MMVRVGLSKIAELWPVLSSRIQQHDLGITVRTEHSLSSVQQTNNMLQELLNGRMHCWIIKDDEGAKAFVITAPAFDAICRSKHLNILCLCSFKYTSDELWLEALETLKVFAKAHGFTSIIGHTKEKRFLNMMIGRPGVDLDYHLVDIKV